MEAWESGEFQEIHNTWYGPGTKYELPLSFESKFGRKEDIVCRLRQLLA